MWFYAQDAEKMQDVNATIKQVHIYVDKNYRKVIPSIKNHSVFLTQYFILNLHDGTKVKGYVIYCCFVFTKHINVVNNNNSHFGVDL